ncbi:MAG TPA: hypothetical protein VGF23_19230 [Gaiellaceae bacterium]
MSEQFSGIVTVAATPGGPPVITIDGGSGDITVGATGRDGDLVLRDASGNARVIVNGQDGTLILRDANGKDSVSLDSRFGLLDLGAAGNEGDLRIRDNAGTFVFTFDASFAVLDLGGKGNEGDLRLMNDAGEFTIHLDGGAGDIKLLGADLAEEFAAGDDVEPGSVVVAVGADEVAVAQKPFDRRVVGVASGAGSLRSALRLASRPDEGRVPVALTGRVYCKADAGHGPIVLGDLLTTSSTEGHAMRVRDHAAAAGAIVGKALGGLDEGRGLVPVLLALQ